MYLIVLSSLLLLIRHVLHDSSTQGSFLPGLLILGVISETVGPVRRREKLANPPSAGGLSQGLSLCH